MPTTYTTREGDAWDEIALSTLGAEHYMDLLLAANPDHASSATLAGGLTLVVPPKPPESVRPGVLPPWKDPDNQIV